MKQVPACKGVERKVVYIFMHENSFSTNSIFRKLKERWGRHFEKEKGGIVQQASPGPFIYECNQVNSNHLSEHQLNHMFVAQVGCRVQ